MINYSLKTPCIRVQAREHNTANDSNKNQAGEEKREAGGWGGEGCSGGRVEVGRVLLPGRMWKPSPFRARISPTQLHPSFFPNSKPLPWKQENPRSILEAEPSQLIPGLPA